MQTNRKIPENLNSKRILAQTALVIERYWPTLWPFLVSVLLVAGFSLIDLWAKMPFWIHTIALFLFLGTGALFSYNRIRKTRWPGSSEAFRALEKNAGLKHRPLDSIGEKATGTRHKTGAGLWAAHQKIIASLSALVQPGMPRLALEKVDRLGIRLALVLFFIVGLFIAGEEWTNRLLFGFTPSFQPSPKTADITILAEPPDYTGMPPQTLFAGRITRTTVTNTNIRIPEGSQLHINVQSERRPAISYDSQKIETEETGENLFTSTAFTQKTANLHINLGRFIDQEWYLQIEEDESPQIAFMETPSETARNSLQVKYAAEDDYGIEKITLTLRRMGRSDIEPQTFDLPYAGASSNQQTAFIDLTPHAWAGTLVEGNLTVTDALGQKGNSEWLEFRLPTRDFTHPVAQELIRIRQSLMIAPDETEGPRRRIDLAADRQQEYDNDMAVYMSLKIAFWRLALADTQPIVDEVIKLLWETALYLEDGATSVAEQRLRQTMDSILERMNDDLSTDEFNALTEDLMAALMDFMMSSENAQSPTNQPQNGESVSVDAGSLAGLMQQMRDLVAAGRMNEARELMQALRQMLENTARGGLSPEEYQQMMAGDQALNALNSLLNQQTELARQTAREGIIRNLPGSSERGSAITDNLAGQQQQLGDSLNDISNLLEENGASVPQTLQEAQDAMERARNALSEGNLEEALRQQIEALQALEEGQQELNEAVQQARQNMGQAGANIDPLGRPGMAANPDEQIIPPFSDLRTAQEILEEIRERLGQPDRPSEEIDYLKRLLERY